MSASSILGGVLLLLQLGPGRGVRVVRLELFCRVASIDVKKCERLAYFVRYYSKKYGRAASGIPAGETIGGGGGTSGSL